MANFFAFDPTGGQVAVAAPSWVSLVWQTSIIDSDFTHTTGTSTVTINTTALYNIEYDVTAYNDGSGTVGTRTGTRYRILRNGSELAGTRSAAYHRNSAVGEDTATAKGKWNLTATDTLVVQFQQYPNANATIATVPNGSRFSIEKIG